MLGCKYCVLLLGLLSQCVQCVQSSVDSTKIRQGLLHDNHVSIQNQVLTQQQQQQHQQQQQGYLKEEKINGNGHACDAHHSLSSSPSSVTTCDGETRLIPPEEVEKEVDSNIQITISKTMKEDVVENLIPHVNHGIHQPTTENYTQDDKTKNRGDRLATSSVIRNALNLIITIYLNFLEKHELLTKCITSGVIGIFGDFLAQSFEHRFIAHQHHQQSMVRPFTLDRIRLFAIFFESTLIAGPLMHHAYNYMEYLIPVHNDTNNNDQKKHIVDNTPTHRIISKWTAACIHVLADVFLLGPIFVTSMMVFTSIIEGRIKTLIPEFRSDFGPALKASILASLGFVPMQLIAFKSLPIQFRLLYMNLQDVVWNAVVSVMAHKSRS